MGTTLLSKFFTTAHITKDKDNIPRKTVLLKRFDGNDLMKTSRFFFNITFMQANVCSVS